MALFYFLDLTYRSVELLQCLFPCIGQLDLGKGDMVDAEFLRIEHGAEAENIALIHQSLQPRLAGCLGKTYLFRQLQHGHAPILAERLENLEVEVIQTFCFLTICHSFSRQIRTIKVRIACFMLKIRP